MARDAVLSDDLEKECRQRGQRFEAWSWSPAASQIETMGETEEERQEERERAEGPSSVTESCRTGELTSGFCNGKGTAYVQCWELTFKLTLKTLPALFVMVSHSQ